jgi:pyruvate/2-oxoglutarate dehydrogenase complex dihydrolipoamide acyltransferase (E2) component
MVDVLMPELGADPNEPIVVSAWFAEVGDEVIEGDRLVELLVGNTTFDVPAPISGRLVDIRAAEDDPVRCGDLLGVIEPEQEGNDAP